MTPLINKMVAAVVIGPATASIVALTNPSAWGADRCAIQGASRGPIAQNAPVRIAQKPYDRRTTRRSPKIINTTSDVTDNNASHTVHVFAALRRSASALLLIFGSSTVWVEIGIEAASAG